MLAGAFLTMGAVVPALDVIATVRGRRVRRRLLGFSASPWLATGKGFDAGSTGGAAVVAVRGRRVRLGGFDSSILTLLLADDSVASTSRWASASLVLLLRAC